LEGRNIAGEAQTKGNISKGEEAYGCPREGCGVGSGQREGGRVGGEKAKEKV